MQDIKAKVAMMNDTTVKVTEGNAMIVIRNMIGVSMLDVDTMIGMRIMATVTPTRKARVRDHDATAQNSAGYTPLPSEAPAALS